MQKLHLNAKAPFKCKTSYSKYFVLLFNFFYLMEKISFLLNVNMANINHPNISEQLHFCSNSMPFTQHSKRLSLLFKWKLLSEAKFVSLQKRSPYDPIKSNYRDLKTHLNLIIANGFYWSAIKCHDFIILDAAAKSFPQKRLLHLKRGCCRAINYVVLSINSKLCFNPPTAPTFLTHPLKQTSSIA